MVFPIDDAFDDLLSRYMHKSLDFILNHAIILRPLKGGFNWGGPVSFCRKDPFVTSGA